MANYFNFCLPAVLSRATRELLLSCCRLVYIYLCFSPCACEFEILILTAITDLVCCVTSTAETNCHLFKCPFCVSRISWAWNVFLS